MTLNVILFGDGVFIEVIKLKWWERGGGRGGWYHKVAERMHFEDHIDCFTSWGKLKSWELITGGKTVWGGENNSLLAGVNCANRKHLQEYSSLHTIKNTFLWDKWQCLAEFTVSIFIILCNWAKDLVSLPLSCHIYKMRRTIVTNTASSSPPPSHFGTHRSTGLENTNSFNS